MPHRIPRATYRLQLTPDFNFAQAEKIMLYLTRLGISEVYSSPLFQASSASQHGYDVNDHNQVALALGGKEGLEHFSKILRAENLGLLVDFVPNHMGIDGEYNWRWRDVLENGENSRYARYFDIEWQPRLDRLKDRVLVPILGDHYGTVLEKGELALGYANGLFHLRYGKYKLPLRPRTYGGLLNEVVQLLPSSSESGLRLRGLAEAFQHLPTEDVDERDGMLIKLRGRLADEMATDEQLREALHKMLRKINGVPGEPETFASLHELLEGQHYRLAYWKVGAHEVNYRRFFAVDTLVGLRMEDPEVFDALHRLLGDLIARETIDGIRLDHIDGLWNPAQYLEWLAECVRRKHPRGGSLYTLVEKILAGDESLKESWAVHGTTGYEFCASLSDLFLDQADEPAWTKIYGDFTGEGEASRDLTYQDKLFVLQELFPNAIMSLAIELDTLIEPDWHRRDISLRELETGLHHLVACLGVYRTYREAGKEMAEDERKWIRRARDQAIARNPWLDPTSLRFLSRVIMGDYPAANASAEQKDAFSNWVCKLQQVTGAIMAKSVEDTHFFRYVRMIASNEVGGHPSRFGQPVNEFHRSNQQRLKQSPLSLLTTSTHDTKMSEDCRARLFALAEQPAQWQERLEVWHRINAGARSTVDGSEAPDQQEEYYLYQLLLAAWPLDMRAPDEDFRNRIKGAFHKAQAEAKRTTSWTYPHKKWEEASQHFIDAILASREFLESFLPFAEQIAERGRVFSVAQTILKLTSPGVPDIYQGNELWDFSMVDPDNRRPVDFEAREKLLEGLQNRSMEDLWKNWKDGAVKMSVIRSILSHRRDVPELFSEGDYLPIEPTGECAGRVVAFARNHGDHQVVVVVPCRLGDLQVPYAGACWLDTRIPLGSGNWTNLLTGDSLEFTGGEVALSEIFTRWPMAVLRRA